MPLGSPESDTCRLSSLLSVGIAYTAPGESKQQQVSSLSRPQTRSYYSRAWLYVHEFESYYEQCQVLPESSVSNFFLLLTTLFSLVRYSATAGLLSM